MFVTDKMTSYTIDTCPMILADKAAHVPVAPASVSVPMPAPAPVHTPAESPVTVHFNNLRAGSINEVASGHYRAKIMRRSGGAPSWHIFYDFGFGIVLQTPIDEDPYAVAIAIGDRVVRLKPGSRDRVINVAHMTDPTQELVLLAFSPLHCEPEGTIVDIIVARSKELDRKVSRLFPDLTYY